MELSRRCWYWKVIVHSADGIRFASRVLECSAEKMVLLLDKALPIGKPCDIQISISGTGRGQAACRKVILQAEVALAVFQSMNVRVTFKIRSLDDEARKLIDAQEAGESGGVSG